MVGVMVVVLAVGMVETAEWKDKKARQGKG